MTYKTKHPSIKEITIGEQFINKRGDILRFVEFSSEENFILYPLTFEVMYMEKEVNASGVGGVIFTQGSFVLFTDKLTFLHEKEPAHFFIYYGGEYDIYKKYITIKEKMEVLQWTCLKT